MCLIYFGTRGLQDLFVLEMNVFVLHKYDIIILRNLLLYYSSVSKNPGSAKASETTSDEKLKMVLLRFEPEVFKSVLFLSLAAG